MPIPAPVRALAVALPPTTAGSTVSAPVVAWTRLLALLRGRLGLMLTTSERSAKAGIIDAGTIADSARTDA